MLLALLFLFCCATAFVASIALLVAMGSDRPADRRYVHPLFFAVTAAALVVAAILVRTGAL